MVQDWCDSSGIGFILMVLSESSNSYLINPNHTPFSSIGITGEVYVNQNGDRETDYTVNDLDPVTGVMTPVGTFFGKNESYTLNLGSSVHWPSLNNRPPLDIPSCGFLGDASHCIRKGKEENI